MSSSRKVIAVHPAARDDIGDLVTRRPVPGPGLEQVDPFLFLNHHGPQVYPPQNRGLPFGPHPHRGFETVTFILDGSLAHLDSGGHESVIDAGGVQWMTAGRGLVHAEVSPERFKRSGGPLEILQLWVNLPSRLKMTAPAYIGLQRDGLPVVELADGVTAQLVSGSLNGTDGPIASFTGVMLATITMRSGSSAELDAPSARNVFLYVVRGVVTIEGTRAEQYNLVELGDGDSVRLSAAEDTVLLFGHADAIGEPVVAHGPFVMNRPEEIRQAIIDYQSGAFGRM